MADAPSVAGNEIFTLNRRASISSLPPDLCEDDSEQTAKAAGLRYVTDADPGIHRIKRRNEFAYLGPDGLEVTDERTLARIRAIVIPPAWGDVWISRWANGHLQATGRDDRGRKQYRYHPRWRTVRDETKYDRMLQFGSVLPQIRKRVEEDLARPGLTREKVLATIVQLLERTLIRVGNDEYARTNDSYGLTTLQEDHVDVRGSSMTFSFRGKSGKEHEIGLRDRRLVSIVRRCRDLPGQSLFQYQDRDGASHAIGSSDVNDYLREISGKEFTAKDFRTWFGTVLATNALRDADHGETERELQKEVVAAVSQVADRLGNTPAVCRKCYIHPVVIQSFLDGGLPELVRTVRISRNGLPHQHSSDERLVLRLLEHSKETESGQ